MTEMTGGCQCGRVRYAAEIDDDEAYLCHCTMCRRMTGAPAAAFVNVALEKVQWQLEPDWYVSSEIARRPFCAACGTPLGFAYTVDAEDIDLALGSFDEPARFRPKRNVAVESLLPHWQDTSHLPGTRSDENEAAAMRRRKAMDHAPG